MVDHTWALPRRADGAGTGMMNDASGDLSPIEALAAEFAARYRRGERPSIDEYAARHPELAERLRACFPALALVEALKPGLEDTTGGVAGSSFDPGPPPDRLGDYRILREVGRGGMGVVYEAEQASLGRRVALKVLNASCLMDAKHLRRFHREARAAAKLHHTNIVPVFGVGEEGGRHYYVMQFIAGHGLDEALDELERPRPESAERSTAADSNRRYVRSVARIGEQVAEALAHAHEQETLHRDIKPSNLLLDGHGHVWVTDFGLAKAAGDADLTHTGDLVGTLRYMAPERFQGRCDARADVYALGLTLYELLARRPAFPANDRHELVRQITREEPPRLRRLDPTIPRDLETIVHKAIEKGPAHRYTSAAELADDLRRFLDDRPIQARRASAVERLGRWSRRNPSLAGMTAAVLLLLVAIDVVAFTLTRKLQVRTHQAQQAAQKAEDDRQEALDLAEREAAARRELEEANARLLETQKELRRALYAARMNLIQTAWDSGNLVRARELLEQTRPGPDEPDLRGFEWFYWWNRANGERRRLELPTASDERGGIFSPESFGGVFSPDGSRHTAYIRFTNRGEDGLVRTYRLFVRETATGRELFRRDLPGLSTVAFNRDGTRLATVWRDGPGQDPEALRNAELVVWDLDDGRELRTSIGPPHGQVLHLEMSGDGKRIAVRIDAPPSPDAPENANTLKVWELVEGELRPQFTQPITFGLYGFSPDDERILLRATFETEPGEQSQRRVGIQFRDAATGRKELSISDDLRLWQPVFSPDGARIAVLASTGDGSYFVQIRDAAEGDLIWSREVPVRLSLPKLVFGPDGRRLLWFGADEPTIRLYDAETGDLLLERMVHPEGVLDARLLPDGEGLVVIDRDGTIKEWGLTLPERDLATPELGPRDFNNEVIQVIGPDGGRVLVGWGERRADEWEYGVYDTATGRELGRYRKPTLVRTITGNRVLEEVSGQAPPVFSPDGRWLAHWRAHPIGGLAIAVRLDDEGRHVVSHVRPEGAAGRDGRLREGDVLLALETEDGDRIAFDGLSLEEFYEAIWGPIGSPIRLIHQREGEPEPRALDLTRAELNSPSSWSVVIWDALTGEPIRDLPFGKSIRGDRFPPPVFIPNSSRMAVMVRRYEPTNEQIQIFDINTGERAQVFAAPDEPYSTPTLAVSPDGKRLALGVLTGDEEDARIGQITVWDLDTGEVIRALTGGAGPPAVLAFSPDGSRIAAGTTSRPRQPSDRSVRVWDIDSGRVVLRAEGLIQGADHLRFSPDGRRLFGAGPLGAAVDRRLRQRAEVKLWDVAGGHELLSLTTDGFINGLAFHSDGETLVAPVAGQDSGDRSYYWSARIRIWDASPPASSLPARRNRTEGVGSDD